MLGFSGFDIYPTTYVCTVTTRLAYSFILLLSINIGRVIRRAYVLGQVKDTRDVTIKPRPYVKNKCDSSNITTY